MNTKEYYYNYELLLLLNMLSQRIPEDGRTEFLDQLNKVIELFRKIKIEE